MTLRFRLVPSAAACSIVALLSAFSAVAAADCPGVADTCPYTTASEIGQRAGGVLRFPQAVAVGADGSVYVGDQSSHTVQVFNQDGTFQRAVGIAGTRPGELSAIGSVAVAGDGTLLVADGGSNRVVRFGSDGSFLNSFGGAGTAIGQFRFGSGGGNDAAAGGGLAVAGDVVYVADTGNDRVQRFTIDGGHGAEIVAPGMLANPRGVAVRGSRLYVADDQHHRVVALDTGGRLLKSIGSGQGTAPGQLNYPYGVAVDAKGRVFVADDLNHRVVRFSGAPNYPYKARWGSYGTAPGQLAYPRGLATDAAGRVYVANTGDDRIDVFDASGTLLRSFGASGRAAGQFNMPLGVAADASGMRAVTDGVNGRLQLLNPDGSVATVWGSPNPGPTILPRPTAVAFDSAGNAYVLDERRSRIFVFDRASGTTSRSIGSAGSGPGQLLEPQALAIDANGTISVADSGNLRIARFNTAGDYLGSSPTDDEPRGIAVAPDGSKTYVADSRNRITVFAADGSDIGRFGGTGSSLGKLNVPGQIALDPAGNLWVADRGNNRVQQFGPAGERLLTLGARGLGLGQFVHPTGVAVDCRGVLTVTDSDNNRVQQFQLANPAAASCAQLAPVGTPPAPKVPTLPLPDGPQVSTRVLRSKNVLAGSGGLPLRVGCDTTCSLRVTATMTPRARPKKGKKAVSIDVKVPSTSIPGGQTKIVRVALSRKQVKTLRKALARRKGLAVTVTITAAASVGQPSTVTTRVMATA